MTHPAPQAFRNACSIEISCDEHGRDCEMVVSCDLVHRQTGELHTFERVINLQPIVAMIRHGFVEATSERVGALPVPGWFHLPIPKQPRTPSGSSRHSQGAQDAAANTVNAGPTSRRTAGPVVREKSPAVLEAEAQAAQDKQDAIDDARDQARQDAQDKRDQARQDVLDERDYKRQIALEDRELARQDAQDKRDDVYAAAHPDSPDSYDDTYDQDDDVSGSIARRIAASKGVADLWSDAHPLIVGGWFDDLKGVANRYAGDIKQGAISAATAIGGPVAGKLASACVDAIAGDQHAQAVVATATTIAKQTGNPDQAKVVAVAKESANQATIAYHAADAAQAAKAGDPQAKAFVAEVHAAAKADPTDTDAVTASKIAARVERGSSGGGYASAVQLLMRA